MKIISIVFFIVLNCNLASLAVDITNEGAYYENITYQCKIDGNKARLIRNEKLVILEARGSKYCQFDEYENKFIDLKNLQIRLVDSSGKEVLSENKKSFLKSCGFGTGSEIYSDICNYTKEVIYSKYPFFVEFESESELKSLFFWGGEYFQGRLPRAHVSYELDCPKDFKFVYKVYGLNIQPEIKEDGGRVQYTWRADSVPGVKSVDFAPDGYPELGRIVFLAEKFDFAGKEFSGEGWKEIGKWHLELAADCYLPIPVVPEPKAFTSADIRAAAKSIYAEIIDKTRYVAVSIGRSGWKPAKADFTQAKGYGDCKGLSTLLISRLRNKGIEAHSVLALTRGEGLIDSSFPSINFNHVFVMAIAGEDTIWMDPTCNECPFGELPNQDENIFALVVTDTGGVAVRTPASAMDNNRIIRATEAHIDSRGSLGFTTKFEYYGNYAQSLKNRIAHLDDNEKQTLANEYLSGGSKKFAVSQYNFENISGILEPFILTLGAERKKPLDQIQNVLYMEPFIFESLSDMEQMDISKRNIPIDQGFPRLKEHIVKITWDSATALDSIILPPSDSVSFPGGKVKVTFEKKSDLITAHLVGLYNGELIAVSDFATFDTYRAGLRNILTRQVKFYKKVY
jgi:hypothetical protein